MLVCNRYFEVFDRSSFSVYISLSNRRKAENCCFLWELDLLCQCPLGTEQCVLVKIIKLRNMHGCHQQTAPEPISAHPPQHHFRGRLGVALWELFVPSPAAPWICLFPYGSVDQELEAIPWNFARSKLWGTQPCKSCSIRYFSCTFCPVGSSGPLSSEREGCLHPRDTDWPLLVSPLPWASLPAAPGDALWAPPPPAHLQIFFFSTCSK